MIEKPGARFYEISHKPHAFVLHHFKPNEKVSLFAYAPAYSRATLKSWQEYTVDQTGHLQVTIQNEPDIALIYVAVGEISGQIDLTEIVSCGMSKETLRIKDSITK